MAQRQESAASPWATNHRLHQEAQEILPPSQRCCYVGDVTAGPEGLICASGKELRNKAASRFRIAESSSPHVLCCTCSLRLASEEFYFLALQRCECTTQLPGLGHVHSCGDLTLQKCKEKKAIGNWEFGIALEETFPLPPHNAAFQLHA